MEKLILRAFDKIAALCNSTAGILLYALKSLLIIGTLLSVACSGGGDIEIGLDTYVYVSGNFSQQDTTALTGSGTIRFASLLPGLNSSKSIEIIGEIYESGSITAIFYSDDIALPTNRGVQVRLYRDNSTNTGGFITVNGDNVEVQSSRLAYISPGSFRLILEVHNTASSSRVILWRKDSVSYSLANVEVDSATLSHINGIYPAQGGLGLYSGLRLVNSHLTTAHLGEANVTIP